MKIEDLFYETTDEFTCLSKSADHLSRTFDSIQADIENIKNNIDLMLSALSEYSNSSLPSGDVMQHSAQVQPGRSLLPPFYLRLFSLLTAFVNYISIKKREQQIDIKA